MKYFDTSNIKNIAILGSPKSGKTTLAETMMFEGGVIHRRGSIEQKNTVSDYHEIEQEKQNSFFATVLHTEWRGQKINIIDTPGYDDFIGEIISSLYAADTGLLLLNSQYGVEVATEIFWKYTGQYNKPVILAVNHLDHEKSDFNATVEKAKELLDSKVVVMQYPYNEGTNFNTIIDLLKMTMYKFPADGGKPEKMEIPDDEKERANQLHNELVEAAAENDDKLMELYFDKGNLDEDEMRQGIRIGMLKRELFPLFCVSAKLNMGSGRLMGFIDNVAPSAADRPPSLDLKGSPVECKEASPGSIFIFKTSIEPHLGEVSYFKVKCGTVTAGDDYYNPATSTKERLSQLFVMDGKNRNPVDKLAMGDIGASVKLKNSHTNNTLNQGQGELQFQPISFPEPRIRTAIVPAKEGEEEKLAEALHDLSEQDKTIIVEHSHELKQLIIHCQGELHLSAVKWHLENIYHIDAAFEEPRVPYRETIEGAADGHYKHKKQSGGAGQFGEVFLSIEPYYEGYQPNTSRFNVRKTEEVPLDWGGKLIFHNCIVGGSIDQKFIPSVLKGIMERLEDGPITGSYVRDVVVYLYDGKMHAVDSNDISFKIAGKYAFAEAFANARPKIMEPIYEVEILAPEEVMGDVMTDLQSRRAIILGMDSEGSGQKIKAKVPLAELYKYSTTLRSITHGRATHRRKFSEYAPVPHDVQEKLKKETELEAAG